MPTINTRVYTSDRVLPDSVTYAGPANTLSVMDVFQLSRVYPKPQGTFKGVAKPAAKFSKTVVVNAATGETSTLIGSLPFSVPVGTPDADIVLMLADMASWLASADALKHVKSLDINA